jgi:hypothetical protein
MKTIREVCEGHCWIVNMVAELEARERERDEAERERVKAALSGWISRWLKGEIAVNTHTLMNAIYPPSKQEIPMSELRERVESLVKSEGFRVFPTMNITKFVEAEVKLCDEQHAKERAEWEKERAVILDRMNPPLDVAAALAAERKRVIAAFKACGGPAGWSLVLAQLYPPPKPAMLPAGMYMVRLKDGTKYATTYTYAFEVRDGYEYRPIKDPFDEQPPVAMSQHCCEKSADYKACDCEKRSDR